MLVSPAIWVDGEQASALPLPDRGLDFGDGLFETLLLQSGKPLFVDLHLERLQAGLVTLGFPDCLELARQYLLDACAGLAHLEWAALRLTVTRGAAPRGYAPPGDATPRVVITAAPLSQDRSAMPGPVALDWADIRWSSQPLLAGIKHLNRLEQVMAAREAQSLGCDDVVVLGQQGAVCSVSAGNIFIFSGGVLRTPALETCGISGTRRRLILEKWAPELSIPVEQGHLSREDVEAADALLICNSLRGIQPVASLAAKQWSDFSVASLLHEKYCESLFC